MALALNVFKTITQVVPEAQIVVYTAPIGYTGVVLLSQIANIGSNSQTATFIHRRSSTDTEIVKNYPIAANDTLSLLSGKLVLESGDRLLVYGSSATDLKFIASILETLN
jgi:hypothetical protein